MRCEGADGMAPPRPGSPRWSAAGSGPALRMAPSGARAWPCHHGWMTGSRSLPLIRLFGIRVGVNYSWFLVLFIVIFVLWDSLSDTLDAGATTVYVVAVVAAVSFFASIVAHELGHALAARREGI